MRLMEKAITPKEFDGLRFNEIEKQASTLIRYLNKTLEAGGLKLTWGSKPEKAEVIEVVNECFQKVGWVSVRQEVYQGRNIITVTKA